MNIPTWIAIVNPNAGSGRVSKEWPLLSNLLKEKGVSFDEVYTTHRYHAVELVVSAIKKGFRNIISVGGDGTVHEIINGILYQKSVPKEEITLAVMPAGSGNDWARMYGIPGDFSKAIETIMEGDTIMQDICKVTYRESGVSNVRYMANVSGVGLDANICYYCNKMKNNGKKGKGSYITAAFKALLGRRFCPSVVKVDGEEFFRGRTFSIGMGIGKYSGGGMIQVPDAVGDDGLLNLMVARGMPKTAFLLHFKKLFNGAIYSVSGIFHTTARKVEIKTGRPDRVEIDGEVVGTTPMTVEVIPNAIRVVIGRASAPTCAIRGRE